MVYQTYTVHFHHLNNQGMRYRGLIRGDETDQVQVQTGFLFLMAIDWGMKESTVR